MFKNDECIFKVVVFDLLVPVLGIAISDDFFFINDYLNFEL